MASRPGVFDDGIGANLGYVRRAVESIWSGSAERGLRWSGTFLLDGRIAGGMGGEYLVRSDANSDLLNGDAAKKLRVIQRNWALDSFAFHRRTALISAKLPEVSAKPIVFGAEAPRRPRFAALLESLPQRRRAICRRPCARRAAHSPWCWVTKRRDSGPSRYETRSLRSLGQGRSNRPMWPPPRQSSFTPWPRNLIEDRSRFPGPWQQPAHHYLIRVVAAARKLVALHHLCRKAGGLLLGLSPVAWKCHPFPNDCPADLLLFHLASPPSLELLVQHDAAVDAVQVLNIDRHDEIRAIGLAPLVRASGLDRGCGHPIAA
jgi:hypothetical protein